MTKKLLPIRWILSFSLAVICAGVLTASQEEPDPNLDLRVTHIEGEGAMLGTSNTGLECRVAPDMRERMDVLLLLNKRLPEGYTIVALLANAQSEHLELLPVLYDEQIYYGIPNVKVMPLVEQGGRVHLYVVDSEKLDSIETQVTGSWDPAPDSLCLGYFDQRPTTSVDPQEFVNVAIGYMGSIEGGDYIWELVSHGDIPPSDHTGNKPKLASGVNDYAYRTNDELVVMDGSERRASEVAYADSVDPESIYEQIPTDNITWTANGRFAATVADAEYPIDRTLLVLDVHKGETTQIPCPYCSSMAAIGESDVLVVRRHGDLLHKILRFDLTTQDPPTSLDIPEEVFSYDSTVLLSGVKDGALLMAMGSDEAAWMAQSDGDEEYFFISEGGSISPINLEHNLIRQYSDAHITNLYGHLAVGPVAPAYADNRNLHFALVIRFAYRETSCEGRDEVFIIEPESGLAVRTDISSVYTDEYTPGLDSSLRVTDLWWTNDGQLHATIGTTNCRDPLNHFVPLAEWRLDNNRWLQESDEPVLHMRKLDKDFRLVTSADSDSANTLYFEPSDGVQEIDSDVRAIETPGTGTCAGPGLADGGCGGATTDQTD